MYLRRVKNRNTKSSFERNFSFHLSLSSRIFIIFNPCHKNNRAVSSIWNIYTSLFNGWFPQPPNVFQKLNFRVIFVICQITITHLINRSNYLSFYNIFLLFSLQKLNSFLKQSFILFQCSFSIDMQRNYPEYLSSSRRIARGTLSGRERKPLKWFQHFSH